MERRKELNYPILKTVLQYLDANQRIELIHRCPNLKRVDLATPLSLNYLYLGSSIIGVNNSTYKLGVLRQFPKDHPMGPKRFQEDNKLGGVEFDLDEFGRWDRSTDKILNTGNVLVETASQPIPDRTDEELDIVMEQNKRRLAHLKTLRKMKERKKEMERIEAYLYTWKHKKEGIAPPYAMYLQYTYKSEKKDDVIEYLEYNLKLYQAMEYLYNTFFNGRKYPVRVHTLKVDTTGGVLRIPESLQIRTKRLYTGTNVTSIMNSIGHLLVGPRFLFGAYGGQSLAQNYTHPEIRNARTLMFNKMQMTGPMFHIVLELGNPRVDIRNGKFTKEEYIRLIDSFIEKKRPKGTYYSFNVHNKEIIKGLFKEIKERDGVFCEKQRMRGCARFPYVYSLPFEATSRINIFCQQNKNFNPKYKYSEPWILWILVEWRSPAVIFKT